MDYKILGLAYFLYLLKLKEIYFQLLLEKMFARKKTFAKGNIFSTTCIWDYLSNDANIVTLGVKLTDKLGLMEDQSSTADGGFVALSLRSLSVQELASGVGVRDT